jgi:hypothetical protein
MKYFTFAFVLFVIFLVLQLTNVIAWSWVWITAPLWIFVAGLVLTIGLSFIFASKIADWQVRKVQKFFDALAGDPRNGRR